MDISLETSPSRAAGTPDDTPTSFGLRVMARMQANPGDSVQSLRIPLSFSRNSSDAFSASSKTNAGAMGLGIPWIY